MSRVLRSQELQGAEGVETNVLGIAFDWDSLQPAVSCQLKLPFSSRKPSWLPLRCPKSQF